MSKGIQNIICTPNQSSAEQFSIIYFSIASLYNWRYRKLGSLPHVWTYPEYQLANAGFEFDYQLINVENFNGVGESEPNPYFFQVSNNMETWLLITAMATYTKCEIYECLFRFPKPKIQP